MNKIKNTFTCLVVAGWVLVAWQNVEWFVHLDVETAKNSISHKLDGILIWEEVKQKMKELWIEIPWDYLIQLAHNTHSNNVIPNELVTNDKWDEYIDNQAIADDNINNEINKLEDIKNNIKIEENDESKNEFDEMLFFKWLSSFILVVFTLWVIKIHKIDKNKCKKNNKKKIEEE